MDAIFRPQLTRVVLTGSESTGKTTLAAQLAAHFGVAFVPEFVREFAEQKGAPIAMSDHGPIAKGQMALENAFAERANHLLIQDTDLVSTVVYCRHYFGRCPEWIEQTAIERKPALYLLMDIDVPWIADGVRDRGDQREDLHTLFANALNEMGANVELISGSGDQRVAAAVGAVERLTKGG